MQIIDTKLKGFFEIQPAIHKDLRGDLLLPKMNKFISPFGYKQEEL